MDEYMKARTGKDFDDLWTFLHKQIDRQDECDADKKALIRMAKTQFDFLCECLWVVDY